MGSPRMGLRRGSTSATTRIDWNGCLQTLQRLTRLYHEYPDVGRSACRAAGHASIWRKDEGMLEYGRDRGVAQPGSALEWGSSGRTFKSSRPDTGRLVTLVASRFPCAPGMGADLEVKVLTRGGNPNCEPRAAAVAASRCVETVEAGANSLSQTARAGVARERGRVHGQHPKGTPADCSQSSATTGAEQRLLEGAGVGGPARDVSRDSEHFGPADADPYVRKWERRASGTLSYSICGHALPARLQLMPVPLALAINLRSQHAHKVQPPVLLRKVKPIADHKLIGDLKTNIVHV